MNDLWEESLKKTSEAGEGNDQTPTICDGAGAVIEEDVDAKQCVEPAQKEVYKIERVVTYAFAFKVVELVHTYKTRLLILMMN